MWERKNIISRSASDPTFRGPAVTERERAVALYTFLKEFAQLRTRTIRDIDSYDQVIWAADIPREHGCDCIAWHRYSHDTSNEVWLEVRKPRLTRPPDPPELVDAWVRQEQLDDSSLDIPRLHTTLLGESAEDPPLRLEDHPEVQARWDTYIEHYWYVWAEQDRRDQDIQKIYTDLFSIFQRQQRLGENFEIVFGLGFLSWNSPDGNTVRRHLTVARVSVEFDTVSGTLTVTPAGEGARPALEQDMLDPQYRPEPQELRAIEEELEKIGESVWEAGPLDGLLKSWVHSVDARGEYDAGLEPPERSGRTPVVHLAPALILRARTERSYIRAFDDIIAQLGAGEPVPEGVSRFINVSEDQTLGDMTRERGNGARPGEIFFPLPANDAQWQIVERLTTNQGVLVQGPPGTGKSHTIVNLTCHALASGQRVLVTSHAVRALKVLQGMIRKQAPDLAPLSVVLLGDDREALLTMEESVQEITNRQHTWDPETSNQTIAGLEIDLDRGRRRQAEILADLRAIREQETFRHEEKFGYTGTLPRIADTLHGERASLSWIPDQPLEDVKVLDDSELGGPPLSASECAELVSLLRNERVSEWQAGAWVSVDMDSLLTAEAFEQAVIAERETLTAYERDAPVRLRPEYSALESLPADDRLDFAEGLGDLVQLIERIDRRPLSWAGAATKQVVGGFERAWRQLYEDTMMAVESLVGLSGWLDANAINPDPGSDLQKLRADAEDLLRHLKGGGGWGFGPFRTATVKRAGYIRELRIGGRICNTADVVGDLAKRIDAEIKFRELLDRWAPYHQIAATNFTDRVAELGDLCEPLEDAFAALTKTGKLSAILRRTPGVPEPDWSDRASLDRLSGSLATFEATQQYEAARDRIDQVIEELRKQRRGGQLHPDTDLLETAVTERNASLYSTARKRAADNLELAAQLLRKHELLHRLMARAHELARALEEAPADPVWDKRAADFELAWNWSQAYAWVTRLAAPDSEQQHRLELENTKNGIALTLEKLAAEKAWAHCFIRMTENERQHLVAWSKSVRAIGRGTGKYAPMHRRNAREHLDESKSAIPAWVMPLHRVAETIKPGSELFDIAIIDEASQSGPEALLLAYLAKKLVVVGDDKQIHPTYAGVNFEDVNQLRERYIAGLPHADAYGVDQSFFDLAEIRYKGRIRLREHFRCMPEIIQFSNNLSYQNEPLIPLRQYGAGRLEPAVTTRHVPDGYLKGTGGARSVNPPEAAAIVVEIAKIHADPAYEDKTIGVISLLGDAQAREIEMLLVRELGPEEMERRQIVCGDAYAFQGDERDVMFLSMVSAPREDRRIPAMTDAAAQRRFNVAASRARDQMYLFHTATLADLNPRCVRYTLLEYCLDPKVGIPDLSGLDMPEIERLSVLADRQRVRPPIPFDSWFELDVFLRIARRGYRVIPQFEVGGYRIDLVVQGMDGNLAVECDGDEWHGPDRYEEDAARQRDLERCGWGFWRVRESVFRLDPDEALEDLWATLTRRRIFTTVDEEMHHGEVQEDAEPGEDSPAAQVVASESVLQCAEQVSASEPLPGNGRASPYDLPFQLSHPEPTPLSGDTVGWLAPYTEWHPADSVPDPRTAEQAQLVALLTEVVECEGPVVAIRVNRASGSQRLTKPARTALNRACAAAVRTGVVTATNPLEYKGQSQLVLRLRSSTRVNLRERGPRELDELPPDEIAAMLRVLGEGAPALEPEELKRQVLGRLGWARLTQNVNEFLDRCIGLV